MAKISMADVMELSVPERIQLVEDIWDSIAVHPDALPITDSQKEELDRRLEDYRQHPDDDEPWEKVKADILSEL